MLSITGGSFKSRKLFAPKTNSIRPTPSIVRKGIFDVIGHFWEGGQILDIFAGTGIMGLEALSRGFENSVFIDNSSVAAGIISRNTALLNLKDQTEIYKMKFSRGLELLKKYNLEFDLIYLDPPYKQVDLINITLELIWEYKLVKENGIILAEHSSQNQAPESKIKDLQLKRSKNWGETVVGFYGF
ncbi:MAG: 16S rRNA (guanine(966)-N(2))-methyltransferase RsmD [Myxococcota bacterium]